jgi:hypothetical protein
MLKQRFTLITGSLSSVLCLFLLLGASHPVFSGDSEIDRKESRGKYYVSVTTQGVKLTVGTQLADLVKAASLVPIQVSVINKSGKRLEVEALDFVLLDQNGRELELAGIQEVNDHRRRFDRTVQRFTKLEGQIGTMNPKLPTNFFPVQGRIAYRSVTLPSNYKMVDTLYFKDEALSGPYTLVMNNSNFDEPVSIGFEITS